MGSSSRHRSIFSDSTFDSSSSNMFPPRNNKMSKKRGKRDMKPQDPKSMSRKEKRKAERKLKKERRNAFARKDFDKATTLKSVDTVFKAKQKIYEKKKKNE